MSKMIEAAKILGRNKADDDEFFLTFDGDDVEGVTETQDTTADIIAAQGEPDYRETDEQTGREVLTWMCSKSKGRKNTLCVVDMDDFRAAVVD